MTHLTLTLLGGFRARLGSRDVTVPLRKARALLGYLGSSPGQTHTRTKLATLLWGDSAEEDALNSLRQTVFVIRKALPAASQPILVGDGELLSVSATVTTDVAEFERLLADGSPEALEHAGALYGGELLEGLDCDGTPFEDWLVGERRRLQERAQQALARLLDQHARAGRTERATHAARRLLALDPPREAAHRAMMQLLASAGRWGAALQQYQLCVDVLRRELDVDPEPETQSLYREILQHRSRSPGSPTIASGRPAPGDGMTLPLVGRRVELEALGEEVARAIAGRARTVVVVGDAGIGKTRLIDALREEAIRGGYRALTARSYETEQILPFGLWVDALRSQPEATAPELLHGLDPVWRRELARLLPEIERGAAPSAKRSGDHRRLFESIARLLTHLAERQPLLVVLDDLHWADEMSVRLLSFLGRRAQAGNVCIVGTARAEALHDAPMLVRAMAELSEDHRLLHLALAPLSKDETVALARELSQRMRSPADAGAIAETVWAVSRGNPLIAVEAIRTMQEHGRQDVDAGRPLSSRVRQIIAGRIGRLSARGRDLLGLAAVIGRAFEFAPLQRASGLDDDAAADCVEELVRRRLLHETGERLDFTHDLVREVAFHSVVEPRRSLLHAAVANALEEVYPGALVEHRAALGVHCREARLWERAVTHFRAAGAHTASRGAYREAVTFFDEALALLSQVPASLATVERAIDLRIDLRDWLLALIDFPRIKVCLDEAEALATTIGDQRRLGRIWGDMAHYFWCVGQPDQTITYARRTEAIGERLGDGDLTALSRFYGGEGFYSLGDYPRAIELLGRNVEALTGERMVERLAGPGLVPLMSRLWMASALAELGDFAAATALLDEAIRAATLADHPFSLASAYAALGRVSLIRGDAALAVEALTRFTELDATWDFPLIRTGCESMLGHARLLAGDHVDGLRLMEHALEGAKPTRGLQRVQLFSRLAEGYLVVGRVDEAKSYSDRALELARQFKERGNEGWTLCLLGDVHEVMGDRGMATRRYRQASTLARALGMRPLLDRCRLGLSRRHARVSA